MLIDGDPDKIAQFRARKIAQWDRVSGRMAGLQLIISGDRSTQFMLVHSTSERYEGIVFGQMPHKASEAVGSRKNPVIRPIPDHRKPFDMRLIDLSDKEIDAVIDRWREGRSAAGLSFVTHVYDQGGKIVAR
jgi:hypothetical protein